MSIAEVEARIRAAVAEAKAKGWRIIRGGYYDGRTGCCVLGACILEEVRVASEKAEVPIRAARAIGIHTSEALRVAVGFDGPFPWCANDEFALLGERLRDLVDP